VQGGWITSAYCYDKEDAPISYPVPATLNGGGDALGIIITSTGFVALCARGGYGRGGCFLSEVKGAAGAVRNPPSTITIAARGQVISVYPTISLQCRILGSRWYLALA